MQSVRQSLYNIWIASCFACDWQTKHRQWLESFLAALRNKNTFHIPALADRIAKEIEKGASHSAHLGGHEYRYWYTIAVDRATVGELGSAMILSSHPLPWDYLQQIQVPIVDIYRAMREVELRKRDEAKPYLINGVTSHHRASDVDLRQWKTVRATSRNLLVRIGKTHGLYDWDNFLWAHHANGGGNPSTLVEMQKAVEELLHSLVKAVNWASQFPRDKWSLPSPASLSGPEDTVPPWEHPPCRALAQFDGLAHDLSMAFILIYADARRC